MKKVILTLIILSGFAVFSCDTSLTEIPKDFASPENSFTNKAGFEAALANINACMCCVKGGGDMRMRAGAD